MDTCICAHCGKEIKEGDACFKMTGYSPLQEETEVSYWCEDCVNEFKAYLEDL